MTDVFNAPMKNYWTPGTPRWRKARSWLGRHVVPTRLRVAFHAILGRPIIYRTRFEFDESRRYNLTVNGKKFLIQDAEFYIPGIVLLNAPKGDPAT